MTNDTIFVGGLSYKTTQRGLQEAFEPYGQILEAKVIVDPETGRSRGFGFVTFRDPAAATAAIEAMNGKSLDGRTIAVNPSTPRKERAPGRSERSLTTSWPHK